MKLDKITREQIFSFLKKVGKYESRSYQEKRNITYKESLKWGEIRRAVYDQLSKNNTKDI